MLDLKKLCAYNLYKNDSKCKRCLSATNPCILGEGNKDSKLAIIGLAPAVEEDKVGRVFVGKSGNLLNKILAELDIDRKDTFITNAIKCLTLPGDKPKLGEVKACSTILKKELESMPNLEKIVALGEIAFVGLQYAFLGKKIKKFSRGEISRFFIGNKEVEVLSTYHPAYVLRNPHAYKIVISDIGKFLKEDNIKINYEILDTYDKVKEYFDYLLSFHDGYVVIDLETESLSKENNKIICIGIATSPEDAVVIPINIYDDIKDSLVLYNTEIETKKIIELLKEYLPKLELCGHNIKFDRHILKLFYDIDITNNIAFDTMVAHHLLREVRPHNLKTLAIMYSRFGNYFDEVKTAMDDKEENWWKKVSSEKIWEYCAGDVCATYDLMEIFSNKLKKENLSKLFTISMEHYKVIMSEMEENGLPFSRSYVEKLSKEIEKEIYECENKLNKLAGREINWNSPKQVVEVFLAKGVKLTKKTKKGQYTVNVEVLKNLAYDYEIAAELLKMRKLVKMKGTYVSILEKYGDKKDLASGKDIVRVRCEVDIVGTETGRLSTRDPSLHTIPRENRFRNMIQAEEGNVIMSGDYSMAELKVMAAYAKCYRMLEAFEEGLDLHRFTASNIFSVPYDSVTSEQRTAAKSTNFGIIYMISAWGLGRRLGISPEEAQGYIDAWFDTYPEIKLLIDKISAAYDRKEVGEELIVKNVYGRKRRVIRVEKYEYNNGKKKVTNDYKHSIRELVNFLPQSTVADTLSIATVRFSKKKRHLGDKCRILLSVHDALLNEVHESCIEESAEILRESMEFKLPFKDVDLVLTADISWNKVWVKD